ncbi:hypothetical protein CC707_24720 [Salmonella enterica subsp. enterica serovar Panama]|uniref:Uncharacterized protein n=1 Tax=Salmonella enterica subsp. enterica serovar Panama TaxID=29472 RepID=A0A636GFI4_SALET|nr:hypothetical protein [Salmonella enterica subsp. enterica serovar Panama]EDI0274277.1 hypothetical protein [Salmonella enterica subsp. enterica serovar Panama]
MRTLELTSYGQGESGNSFKKYDGLFHQRMTVKVMFLHKIRNTGIQLQRAGQRRPAERNLQKF